LNLLRRNSLTGQLWELDGLLSRRSFTGSLWLPVSREWDYP
jgi:hypothetical protein